MPNSNGLINRRKFVKKTSTLLATTILPTLFSNAALARASKLKTRGVVLSVDDLKTLDWPSLAHQANLTTIATHVTPSRVSAFIQSDKGQQFLHDCKKYNLQVEHELHSMSDLLPRSLFAKDRAMFRMNEKGERVADFNCCVHSKDGLEIITTNAVKYSKILHSTTGRYFYWIDDAAPMCRCNQCKELSDSEQALLVENAIIKALQTIDPNASLAHLAYQYTIVPPKNIKPEKAIFLEFAPIVRQWDKPLTDRSAGAIGNYQGVTRRITHGECLDVLAANLEVFPKETAQVLEYWLDVSLQSKWTKPAVKLSWHPQVCKSDVETYMKAGVSNVTSFAVYVDDAYKSKYGDLNFVKEYGDILKEFAVK
jgi:hypothetical protein